MEKITEKMLDNIYHLSWSMQDAPYHGVSRETIEGVNFAIDKILKDTGYTLQDVINKTYKKGNKK